MRRYVSEAFRAARLGKKSPIHNFLVNLKKTTRQEDGLGRKARRRALSHCTQVGRQAPYCKNSTVDPPGWLPVSCSKLVSEL